MPFRVESGRLDRAERTAAGGLRIPAAIGRAGILVYRKADGSDWREYRPASEAFAAESLASLRGAPVTDLHPTRPVSPDNFRALARGHVGDDPRADADGAHIAASVYVSDADLIGAIEAGDRSELSAGYSVDLEMSPGTTPEGEHFDAIQRNLRYNHVAVGPKGWGRAGPTVALRLDGALEGIFETETTDGAGPDPARTGKDKEGSKMEITIRLDSTDYKVETDETAAQALPAAIEQLRARADAAEKAVEETRGRAETLETALAAANDPARISALVAARVALETAARSVKADVRTDGTSDRALMLDALGLPADSDRSDDWIRGAFETTAKQSAKADASMSDARRAAAEASAPRTGADVAARDRMIERNRRLSCGENVED